MRDVTATENDKGHVFIGAPWPSVKLGDVAEFVMGQAPPGSASNFDGKGTIFVKAGEFGPLHPVVREWTTVPLKYAKSGDVLICVVGATAGKLNLGIDCAIGRSVAAIRPGARTFDRFLYFQLLPQVMSLRAGSTGSAQGVINRDMLADIELLLPPLPIQRRIVAQIEKLFTGLEAGVAALKRVQAGLKRYRAAVLKAACEGRLIPTEVELHRQRRTPNSKLETGGELLARILAERRAKWQGRGTYKEPAAPDTANLPSLPKGWAWGTWNQLSNWVTYGFTRPMPHVGEGIPIITAKGVNNRRIDFERADLTTKSAYVELSEKDRPQPGDILITKDGTIGRAAVVDVNREFCINQSVAVIWLRSCPLERKFLLIVIDSELTQKPIWAKARGVAIQHLSITDFAKMAVPVPPLAEQTRIVAEVERRLSVIEELEAVVSANLQRAGRLRQAILQHAFSGGPG